MAGWVWCGAGFGQGCNRRTGADAAGALDGFQARALWKLPPAWGEKTRADLQGRAGPGLDRKNVLEGLLEKAGIERSIGDSGKRRAMAVGAILSGWVMELGVLTLIGLV